MFTSHQNVDVLILRAKGLLRLFVLNLRRADLTVDLIAISLLNCLSPINCEKCLLHDISLSSTITMLQVKEKS